MKVRNLFYIGLALILAGCSSADDVNTSRVSADARELEGVKAVIEGADMKEGTREGTVTTLVHYVGRNLFVAGDQILFTKIKRTNNPISNFTYPTEGSSYEGILYVGTGTTGGGVSWDRSTKTDGTMTDGGPDRVYWTDASSPHTFKAYSIPQGDFDWAKDNANPWYYGSVGDPSQSTEINYSSNDVLKGEDLLIAYDEAMLAEPGGSVALVKFRHALSSIRVVVNINGFSAGKEAASDNQTRVFGMKLLNQPTKYVWKQVVFGAEAVTDGQVYRNMMLWMPDAQGTNEDQSRIFTFYGITTPHAESNLQLQFTVTYPNPLQPSQTLEKTYTATLENVKFEAGYNTTVNVTLNHKNEMMTVGAEYENWQFASIPHEGRIKKNSTFLQGTERESVTIVGDEKATIDDATWLYELNGTIYDIYGNDGSEASKAYRISTADQLLSFAYEVKNGRTFEDKFVRLDADITLQKSSAKTKAEIVLTEDNESEYNAADDAVDWIGIGDETHAFNGTFLGGKRFVYRLKGKPLFINLAAKADIKQLQVNTVHKPDGSTAAVEGSGLFADSNAGMLSACKVVGDVAFDGTTVGAFVGTNTGKLWCCYHIGATIGTTGAPVVGGLVGNNSGIIASCYHAGKVTGTTTGGIAASGDGFYDNSYYDNKLLSAPAFTPAAGVVGKTTSEMTKEPFVNEINDGISTWRSTDDGYDAHSYVYQPANYPILSD